LDTCNEEEGERKQRLRYPEKMLEGRVHTRLGFEKTKTLARRTHRVMILKFQKWPLNIQPFMPFGPIVFDNLGDQAAQREICSSDASRERG